MPKGNFTATAVSTVIVAADAYREYLLIQKGNATQVAIGIGEAAVAGEGVQLINIDSSIELWGWDARQAITVIGNGGTGTYQDGQVRFRPGPYAA